VKILITAGNTQAPIDRVRCITNIFSGRTGASIAAAARDRGHAVTLTTSHPEVIGDVGIDPRNPGPRLAIQKYRTFDDLAAILESLVRESSFDAICHAAAVSDYLPVGIYAPAEGTVFDESNAAWESPSGSPSLIQQAAGKIKSDRPELWLRLIRAPKLIDRFREPWGFAGILVKFKLEVGVSDADLLDIAEHSRRHSGADLMVANTLERASDWAYIGPVPDRYDRVSRRDLPERLLQVIERRHREQADNG
jgi:phosphopantothenoylcysteine synthetase/decarboxylase